MLLRKVLCSERLPEDGIQVLTDSGWSTHSDTGWQLETDFGDFVINPDWWLEVLPDTAIAVMEVKGKDLKEYDEYWSCFAEKFIINMPNEKRTIKQTFLKKL